MNSSAYCFFWIDVHTCGRNRVYFTITPLQFPIYNHIQSNGLICFFNVPSLIGKEHLGSPCFVPDSAEYWTKRFPHTFEAQRRTFQRHELRVTSAMPSPFNLPVVRAVLPTGTTGTSKSEYFHIWNINFKSEIFYHVRSVLSREISGIVLAK